ncbi:MAG: hypothetical protein Kow0090_03190 [Myxococcota bacterium]
MCKMLAAAISNGSLLSRLIKQHEFFLKPPETFEADGYGVGYYLDERPLLSKLPRLATPPKTYYEMVKDINSNLLILHARRATVGGWKDENTHPFRFEPWLFAHTGTAELLQKRRSELYENLPTHLRNNIKGDTDSELLFMLILSNLGDLYQITSNVISEQKVITAIRKTLSQLGYSLNDFSEHSGAIFLTNGNLLLALSCGEPLHMRVQDVPPPMEDKEGESAHYKKSDVSESGNSLFKSVLLAVSSQKAVMGFEPIEPGTIIIVHKSLEIMRAKLSE